MDGPLVEYVGIDEDEGSARKQKTDKILIEQARALIDSGTKVAEIYNLLDEKLTKKQIYFIQNEMRRYSKKNKFMDDKPNSTIYKRNDSQVILCDQCSKGQLISNWLFDFLNFPKNQCKNSMNYCHRI